jgi:1-acyl-sn-glycerol-3-phosphate acyltransferase
MFFSCFYGTKASGLENIPLTGGVIIACNHRSNIDPPAVCYFVERVRVSRFMTKKELFDVPFLGTALRQADCISVDRKRPGGDLAALRKTIELLKAGHMVVIFPEGTRSRDGQPLEPKLGLGLIAAKSGAPVVPVRLEGTAGFPFTRRITLAVGKPIRFEKTATAGEAAKTAYAEISRKVMEAISSLTEENAPSAAAEKP